MVTPPHYLSSYSSSVYRTSKLQSTSIPARDTHVTPVVPARTDIRVRVAHAVADLHPIPGAVGELGDNSGVKAGRILALVAQHAARKHWAINTVARAAPSRRIDVQARAGREGRGGWRTREASVVRMASYRFSMGRKSRLGLQKHPAFAPKLEQRRHSTLKPRQLFSFVGCTRESFSAPQPCRPPIFQFGFRIAFAANTTPFSVSRFGGILWHVPPRHTNATDREILTFCRIDAQARWAGTDGKKG